MTSNHELGEGIIPAEGIAVAHDAMSAFHQAKVPFLVGGAYALAVYTGIERYTKDFDVFVRESDVDRALEVLDERGFETEIRSEVWIAKAFYGEEFVDLIFNSGNSTSRVDDSWFDHAVERDVFGVSAKICPPEEIIWSKAYIMERERFDGADIAHILRCCAGDMDWTRLVGRFGDHWRVLLSHLILFGFIYPQMRDNVPDWVMSDLLGRAERENQAPAPDTSVCRGTLLSRAQYGVDVHMWGCVDARVEPHGELTEAQARALSPTYRCPPTGRIGPTRRGN
jgi:hypothetical protein